MPATPRGRGGTKRADLGSAKETVMGAMGIGHWLIVLAIVLVVFGGGKLGGVGKSLGQGIREFKDALRENEENKDETTTGGAAPKVE